MIQFFDVSFAPLIEEFGFRVMLIGLPLFMLYSHKSSFKFLVKSLWMPWQNLHNVNMKNALMLIVIVGVFFGVAHIFSDEAWSSGKLAQAVT
ncbi:MAG: CPBP family intramembrane metalloprotease, partial [Candidatus Marinimicrobia bacterium]|nr:CPBP family intramembrane metalloprotease [Candidatus Neomarinimicrobiota bacterium]